MPKFERHIFICTNQRPEGHPRGCCSPSGDGKLHRLFKAKLADCGIRGTVRANKAGCLMGQVEKSSGRGGGTIRK